MQNQLLTPQNPTATGHKAEAAVVIYLVKLGHKVLARNYRTRFYEIDIISAKGERIFFTEVKYRKNDQFGDGLEHITPHKLSQMRFAAQTFMNDCRLDYPASLAAASVTGQDFRVTEWMEIE